MMIMGLVGCGKGSTLAARRNISVTDINGTAEVTKSGKSKDAFKGQQLVSGDAVDVHSSSDMTLILDEDKHVFASENSHFALEATGKSGATKTKIIVDNGTTLIGIDNKLSDEETFEVATPNATMAVRGTVFYVTVTKTEDGTKTELVVKEGTVEARTVENGQERTDIVDGGKTVAYFGTAPGSEQSVPESTESNDSSEQQAVEDNSNASSTSGDMFGVYRGDGYTIVIAEGVPYAYNSSEGVIIESEDSRRFCVVTDSPGLDPFFARSATMVSDTLITDYTFREDENVHVVDMEFERDGDTLKYHRHLNEDNYDEYATLTRTGEDPASVYLSYIK